ncbi:MAG TPA: ABC transporter permease [Gemmatimonadales bacterium]|nr:ABC transporter permease [Gemmatimonadales bacterium]
MSLWRQLTRGLRVLTSRNSADRDLNDEVADYLARATAAGIARGLTPDEARRAARVEMGSAPAVRQEVRSAGWEHVVSTTLGDLRYAARRLRKNPGFTAVSVTTLALGIGASTAIFSAVNPILFEALPYPDAARITMVSDAGPDGTPMDVTFGTYLELAGRSQSFEATAAFKAWQPTMIGDAEPVRLTGQRVGAGFFRALGVSPGIGRDFQPLDDVANGPSVAMLSDGLWRRRFAADPGIIGRGITLDDRTYIVIGVMPSGFENVLAPAAELWAPLQYRTVLVPESREWGHHLRMVARLRPGTSLDQASRELDAIANNPVPQFPRVAWASLANGLITTSLQADVTRGIRPALLAVLGAVLLVLAIACVNVTNLLLGRGAQRRGEFAMRAAIGAGRSRLVRQMLTESVLLALIGGVLGMIVAQVGVRALVALSPPGLPRVGAIRLDGGVLGFGIIITTLIGVLVGVIPAIQASREDLQIGLQHSSRRTAGGHRGTRGVLVVAEVALALMLLVGAGLLLRSIGRALAVPVGFDASHLLTMQVQESGRRYASDSARYRFYLEALEAVRQVPGVRSAGFTAQLPLSGDLDMYGVHFERELDPANDGPALRYAVTPGYFETMGIPLRRGRLLDGHDEAGAPRAAVINETFAAQAFPGQDPIGQRFRFGPTDGEWFSIVGIVGDVKQATLELGQANALYITPAQWHWADNLMSLVVRGSGDVTRLTPAIRRAIWSVDKDQPIVRVATMDDLVGRALADRRFALILFEAFGIAALSLAATGLYGVLSGSVTERMREIGVRSALGATRGEIVGLVARQGMTLAVIGAAIGALGAAAATQAIASLLFGVSRLDPVTWAGVTVLLLAVSAIACWVPAWRAARIDPVITLRSE